MKECGSERLLLSDVGSPIRHASHPYQTAEPTNNAPIALVIILMSFVQIVCGTPLAQAKNASAAQARQRTKCDRKVKRGRYTLPPVLVNTLPTKPRIHCQVHAPSKSSD
jgi:hypothetical protein